MEFLFGAALLIGVIYIVYRVVNRKKVPKPPYVGGGTGGTGTNHPRDTGGTYQDEVQ